MLGRSGWNQIPGTYTHRDMTLGSLANTIWPHTHQQFI